MPIFDFICSECDTRFEELVKTGQTAVCPSCGSNKTEQQLSNRIGVKFVGPGFHNTDYKKKSSRK